MSFAAEGWLAALGLVILVGAWLLARARAAESRAIALLGPRWARAWMPGIVRRRRVMMSGVLVSLLLLNVSLARPRWGTQRQPLASRAIDIMVALDVSRSMAARDVEPSRADRARWLIERLRSRLSGERIGLVIFAGEAVLACPCTADLTAFSELLAQVDAARVDRPGTDLGRALRRVLEALPGSRGAGSGPDGTAGARPEDRRAPEREQMVVLVSDGEDLSLTPGVEDVAMKARLDGVAVHTVVVGTREGATIPDVTPAGREDRLVDESGRVVVTRANTALMERIARAGGGLYLDGAADPYVMEALLASRWRAPDGSAGPGSARRDVPVERFQWPLLLAIVSVVLGGLAGAGGRRA